MKKSSLLLMCFIGIGHLFAQRDITGCYENRIGRIIIKDDKFSFIAFESPWGDLKLFYSDTQADCTFEWIDNNFIELNSTYHPQFIAEKGFKMTQFRDSIVPNDSIKFTFFIPCYDKLDISVLNVKGSGIFTLYNYSSKNRELMMHVVPEYYRRRFFREYPDNPNAQDCKLKAFMLVIRRSKVYGGTYCNGLNFSLIDFSSIGYNVEENINHILIEIPAIDDAFFEKYQVIGEYANVTKRTITWKGNVFVKSSKGQCQW